MYISPKMIFTETIKLSGLRPLTSGARRRVYTLPGHPDLLVKVVPPHKVYAPRMVKRLIHGVLASTRYRNVLSEVNYEMVLSLRLGPDCSASPLPKCLGVVSTDLGAGVMVERISDRTGGLARTLSDLCASNEMDRDRLCHLNNLVSKLFDMHIVAPDLHAGNIVFGQRHGKDAFFVVDGYGERTVIPRAQLVAMAEQSFPEETDGKDRVENGSGLVGREQAVFNFHVRYGHPRPEPRCAACG